MTRRAAGPVDAEAPPVKVLRLIARLNTGGPAIHTVLLTEGLNGSRFHSRLVTGVVGPEEGDMGYYAARRGVVPVVIPELGRRIAPWSDLVGLLRILRLLRRERPDIVHTHTAKAGVLGRLAAWLYNASRKLGAGRPAKVVHSFHGHLFRGYFAPWKVRLLLFIERVLARVTDHVVVVSEAIERDVVEVYRICPPAKVSVIRLGLDLGWVEELEHHRGRLRAEFGIPPNGLVIGIVGRLTAVKNHRLFLAAVSRVRRADLYWLVVGDGELRPALETSARALGVGHRVTFTGWVREPARIYADIDVVCLTSRSEGTPVALIEAMAAGRPFVAADVGGVRDLMIGRGCPAEGGFEVFANGILVPPENPIALSSALEFLVERPDLLLSMGQSGREAAPNRYGYRRLLDEMEILYRDLLVSKAGR